ncbi:uncharacterized protein LOC135122247 [Zophobas morio]|uniref:uncharacterized protein LOC135122247 n=1 Tax=Zophobas morio TaxID=2755281 RepID=UPI003083109B
MKVSGWTSVFFSVNLLLWVVALVGAALLFRLPFANNEITFSVISSLCQVISAYELPQTLDMGTRYKLHDLQREEFRVFGAPNTNFVNGFSTSSQTSGLLMREGIRRFVEIIGNLKRTNLIKHLCEPYRRGIILLTFSVTLFAFSILLISASLYKPFLAYFSSFCGLTGVILILFWITVDVKRNFTEHTSLSLEYYFLVPVLFGSMAFISTTIYAKFADRAKKASKSTAIY